ncbi:translocation/assembly module TamB domain-containing protein [Armatimonas sp.]|uniref:translocation/assembly module TamB domain-containing protein n=1 Tax=Armatimonas sp. TaxID=1872638 RepID=UPI003753654C
MRYLGAATNGLLALLVALAPPLFFVVWAWPQTLARFDQQLAQSKLLLEEEASIALERPVHFAKLSPNLSLVTLRAALTQESLPIVVEGLELGARPDELRWTGQDWLIRVPRLSLSVSPAALQQGKFSETGVEEIVVESPDLLVYRTPEGKLSVEDFLPKPKMLPDPTQPPFQTRVRVRNAHVRLRDFASLRAPGRAEENSVERLDATIDLSGTRTLRFIARAFPSKATVTRLAGPILLEGTARRNAPGPRPDSPSQEQPLLRLSATVRDADLPYWIGYTTKPRPEATLTRGRIDTQVTLLLPSEKSAPPIFQVEAQFRKLDILVKTPAKLPLTELGGSATYGSGTLTAAIAGNALGESFLATGRVTALDSEKPYVAATLTMPRVPLRKGLALLPALKLPKELRLGPTLRLEGATLLGALNNPQVTAHLSGLEGQWQGLPALTAQARVTYADGLVQATTLTAALSGGGTLTGQGSYSAKQRTGTFEAHLRGAQLSRVALLRDLKMDLKNPPTGQLDVDFRGKIQNDVLTASGLAQTKNLRIVGLDFPTASARLSLNGKRYQVTEGTLAGSMGVFRLAGSGQIGGQVALEGHLVAADLGQLADAFGLPGVGGTLSASAQLTGTQTAPVLSLRDVTVLQPRYRFENRLFVADSAHAERASLRLLSTGEFRVELDPMQPLRISRSPAIAELAGTIIGAKNTAGAQLNLSAKVENLELSTVLSQLSEEPGRFAPEWLQITPGYRTLLEDLDWTGIAKPPVSGFIRSANATIRGDTSALQIEGDATLGRFLVADFPLEGGTLTFTRNTEAIRVQKLVLNTATGIITGEAQLTTEGKLSGALRADALNLATLTSLEGLADKQLGITGTLSASLTLAGSREHPVFTAKLTDAQSIKIIGIPITNLEFGEIRFAPEIEEDQPLLGTILLPRVALQLGDTGTSLSATDIRYDLKTRQLSSNLDITQARFQKVVKLLQGAHLDNTPEGRDFIQALYTIPSLIDATVALTGNVAARLTEDGPRDRRARFALTSPDLSIQTEGASKAVQGKLAVSATLTDERLDLDAATLALTDAQTDEPTLLRLLRHPGRDRETGESVTTKSWLRLPYDPKEPLEYHLTLDANAIPLGLVSTLAPGALPVPVQGKAAVTIAADGTVETPKITASFFADNLLLGDTIGYAGQFNAPPLLVDQLRFQVELLGKNKQDWNITLSDGRLTHAKEILTFEGQLPYDNASHRIAARRPISLHVALDDAAGLTVATLSQYFRTGKSQLTGIIRGNVTLKGSLSAPELDGKLSLTEASARFPNPSQRLSRDVINPIQHLELALELTGKEIRFPKAELSLAQLPPQAKVERGKPLPVIPLAQLPSAGTLVLEPGSVIRIENLEDFTRLFVRRDEAEESPRLRGEFDLKARFTKFQLDTDNASALMMNESLTRSLGGGLAEALKGEIDGQVLIQGPLLTPTIATAANQNLKLSDLSFRYPRNVLPESAQNNALLFNPRFAIALETASDARLTISTLLEFKATGGVTISGDLAAPKIEGVLTPTGGYFKYPLATFTVQRGGELRLTYAKRYEAGQDRLQFDLRAQDVTATAKVMVSSSTVKSSRSNPSTFDPNRLSNQIPEELAGRRISVTTSFNGLLQQGDTAAQAGKPQPNFIRLSSDPALSEPAILSLLFPYQLLAQLSPDALREGANLVSGGIFGAIITPITGQFGRFFGLEDISLDYGLDGLANLYFIRRLPEPFEKVTIEVRRTFQTRSGSGKLLPELYSLNYEIGQLWRGSRLQLGASTNEQRDSQLFLRGTFRY